MCKEVDNDSNNTGNSVKVKTRDTKVLPVTEAPVTIPENNKFSPPKHRVSNAKNDVKIDGNEVEDVSFSSLEASNNSDSQNLKNTSNNNTDKSTSTEDENNESSNNSTNKGSPKEKQNESYSEYSTSNSESNTYGSDSASGSESTYSNDSWTINQIQNKISFKCLNNHQKLKLTF